MRVLITGGAGFVGQWLARELLRRGDEVVVAGLGASADAPGVLDASERARLRWLAADMRRDEDVGMLVETARPEIVFHLAGVSFVPAADRAAAAAYDVNVLGAVRLLSALADARAAGAARDPVVLLVGSATQYGAHDSSAMPLREDAEQRPLSVYGASKAAQEAAGLLFHRSTGLRVICTRSFNHSGVGHDRSFLLPALVGRVRDIERGALPPVLALGNDAVRDYLHVADVVNAYLLLTERGTPGEVYNVCSGVGISARRLAADVLLRAGVRAEISTDPSLVRAAEIPVLVGSPEKLMRATGWTPRYTHADILDDLLRFAHASKE